MLVHIVNGTYGHRPTLPNGALSPYVVPVTRNDLPIDVSDEEAARLVEKGIAEYVADNGAVAHCEGCEEHHHNGNTPEDENPAEGHTEAENDPLPSEDAIFTADMRADELRAAMRERGLAVKIGMTKQAMVDALNGTEEADTLPPVEALDVVDE